jgi:hypothetical protein
MKGRILVASQNWQDKQFSPISWKTERKLEIGILFVRKSQKEQFSIDKKKSDLIESAVFFLLFLSRWKEPLYFPYQVKRSLNYGSG